MMVIENYQTESNLIRTELKKLYKTMEKDRSTLHEYERLIKDQQKLIERSAAKVKKYEDSLKVKRIK